jgi:HEAT repeat protein
MGLFGPPDVEKMKAKKDDNGLIRALRYQKGFQVRVSAAALGEIGDHRAIEPLIATLKDEEYRNRPAGKGNYLWEYLAQMI